MDEIINVVKSSYGLQLEKLFKADLPGLWNVRSQSLLLTGAHNLLKAQLVSARAGCSHIALRE